jgi:hypothetical protein
MTGRKRKVGGATVEVGGSILTTGPSTIKGEGSEAVAYFEGPPVVWFVGRLWVRGKPQPMTANEVEAAKARKGWSDYGFSVKEA